MTTINRNYDRPTVAPQWASSRATHMAVAVAIHAIADAKRTPRAIWEAPSAAEFDHVTMAVTEYVNAGDFEPTDDGCYPWGPDAVQIGNGTGECGRKMTYEIKVWLENDRFWAPLITDIPDESKLINTFYSFKKFFPDRRFIMLQFSADNIRKPYTLG